MTHVSPVHRQDKGVPHTINHRGIGTLILIKGIAGSLRRSLFSGKSVSLGKKY